jgi:hypothetical protein
MSQPDYQKYHQLEAYLFGTVGPQFRQSGVISATDFFCIVIWKSNRSKSTIANRLRKQDLKGRSNLSEIIKALGKAIHQAPTDRKRLEILLTQWGFRLPMASAILTVLYPDSFSIYDIRVCEQLGEFKSLAAKRPFDRLWKGYQAYLDAVRQATPRHLSLRDKDRWLWGKSFIEQLESDLNRGFKKS